MRRQLFLMLLLCGMALGFPEASLDLRNIEFLPSPANPGSAVTMQATLVHTGTLSYSNVTIIPDYVYPFTAGTQKYVIPRMDPGQRFPVTLTFNVSSDAEASVYPLDLNVVDWNIEYGDRAEKQFRVSVPVSSTPELAISGTEFTGLEPGSRFSLKFVMNNTAAIQTGRLSVSLSVDNDPGFLFYTSNPMAVDNIPGKSSRALVFSGELSPNAAPGTYKGSLKITYQGGEFDFPVYLLIKGQSGLSVTNISSSLAVGSEGALRFNFQNPLPTKLTNVRLRISPGFKYYTREPEQFFKTIQPKQSEHAEYTVFVDRNVKPGSYDVKVSLYSDQVTRETSIPVLVKGMPELSLSSVSYDVDRVTSGQPVLLSIQLENIGTGDARNVKLTVSGVSGQLSQELGTIEKEDTGTGVFDVKFNTPGDKLLGISVVYEDDYGNVRRESFTAEVYVNSTPPDYTWVIGVLTLAVVLFLYASRKRKRMKWLKKVF